MISIYHNTLAYDFKTNIVEGECSFDIQFSLQDLAREKQREAANSNPIVTIKTQNCNNII